MGRSAGGKGRRGIEGREQGLSPPHLRRGGAECRGGPHAAKRGVNAPQRQPAPSCLRKKPGSPFARSNSSITATNRRKSVSVSRRLRRSEGRRRPCRRWLGWLGGKWRNAR